MEEREIYIRCGCGDHGLLLNGELEFYGPKKDRMKHEIYLTMYGSKGYMKGPGFWDRLRIAWRVLRRGHMHTDQLVLDHKAAQQLANWLEEEFQHVSSQIESRNDLHNGGAETSIQTMPAPENPDKTLVEIHTIGRGGAAYIDREKLPDFIEQLKRI